MKNVVRVMSVMLVVAMLAVTLVACGGVPSGTYVNGDTSLTNTYTQYEFKGSKVTFTSYALGKKVEAASFEGKYKVDGDEITFTWEDSEGKEQSNTVTYAENEDGSLEIGPITYKKK
ncbi:MAG: hypothetical protein E7644_08200 [Ruminococcaceae bacterium]|nr:hypothetical protein [Oscillospiraceae bacterium]